MLVFQNSNLIFWQASMRIRHYRSRSLYLKTNKQKRKQVWGLPAWRETHLLEQPPHTNFSRVWDFCPWLFSIHWWAVEAKGAGWWSAPIQPMLGNCQDYNAPLLVGLAAMPRAEWATETELVMTTAGSSSTTRSPPQLIAGPPWDDSMAWRWSDASYQHVAPSGLVGNSDFHLMILLIQ